MKDFHCPVLLKEVLEIMGELEGYCVDGTVGGGGHARLILKENPKLKIIGIDRDPRAVKEARKNLKDFSDRTTIVQGDFRNFPSILGELRIEKINGFFLDLGVSSHHLDTPERGFSYHLDGPLDMRMDPTQGISAGEVVNTFSVEELKKIIKDYGEEKWAKRIASFIARERVKKPIETTQDLVAIIKAAIPAKARARGPHPARRTFQALRIFVNEELHGLAETLEKAVERLDTGGRIVVISFHSLEDRIVKDTLRSLSFCICPKNLPCQCDRPIIKILTKKPLYPSQEEIERNPRARSARMRAGEKI